MKENARVLAQRVGKEDGAVVLLQCQLDFELTILRENKKVKYDFEATLKSANFANDSKFEIQLESKLVLAWYYFHQEKLEEAAEVLQRLNITPSIPTQPYLARLTAVALAIKAVLTEDVSLRENQCPVVIFLFSGEIGLVFETAKREANHEPAANVRSCRRPGGEFPPSLRRQRCQRRIAELDDKPIKQPVLSGCQFHSSPNSNCF